MYLLDTDIISTLVRPRPSEKLIARLSETDGRALGISVMTLMELHLGERLASRPEPIRKFIEDFVLPTVTVIDFDREQAQAAAGIQADLRRAGKPLDWLDIMIAACALKTGRVLVTGNLSHYQRIAGLKIENWLGG